VWEGLQITPPEQALSMMRTLKPALVVTPTDIWLERENLLRALLDRCECPLIFIGDTPPA